MQTALIRDVVNFSAACDHLPCLCPTKFLSSTSSYATAFSFYIQLAWWFGVEGNHGLGHTNDIAPDIWDTLVMTIITKGPIYMHNTFPSLMASKAVFLCCFLLCYKWYSLQLLHIASLVGHVTNGKALSIKGITNDIAT